MKIREKVIAEIKKVYDPEIPVNIYDLGLFTVLILRMKTRPILK